jgi:hypothetical protein
MVHNSNYQFHGINHNNNNNNNLLLQNAINIKYMNITQDRRKSDNNITVSLPVCEIWSYLVLYSIYSYIKQETRYLAPGRLAGGSSMVVWFNINIETPIPGYKLPEIGCLNYETYQC